MKRLLHDAESDHRSRLLAAAPGEADRRLLEIGCGGGAWSEALARTLGIPSDQVFGSEVVEERAALGLHAHRS
jgi:cyclopropane fatty-acyl-phospholipid synthase-like methyltransferase